ncbi:MAG: urease accessory protein UreF [Castellaniella sp.]|uniref:urease accessory protein UreF n=1 Tax=Castellaniella sp. TaxID=1955812 RepID=UPI0011FF2801|nr:urease accessory UreF family protein [Castellaniella sp.]TAN28666.1 MAG: urease accessory protein UreF [Castellaniella sp.]
MNPDAPIAVSLDSLTILQQISSPALPIGGFTYSQGLEAAVELRLIHDEASAAQWITAQLHTVMTPSEAPLWCLLFDAWQRQDDDAVRHWNGWFHASRETQEIRQETEQMGRSLARLARELSWVGEASLSLLDRLQPLTLPLVHSLICATARIPQPAGLSAYLFTWLENQIAAAVKSVPLGQTAGQRILDGLRRQIPALVDEAQTRSHTAPPALHTLAPQYGIVSSRHASQFSRLFRS